MFTTVFSVHMQLNKLSHITYIKHARRVIYYAFGRTLRSSCSTFTCSRMNDGYLNMNFKMWSNICTRFHPNALSWLVWQHTDTPQIDMPQRFVVVKKLLFKVKVILNKLDQIRLVSNYIGEIVIAQLNWSEVKFSAVTRKLFVFLWRAGQGFQLNGKLFMIILTQTKLLT